MIPTTLFFVALAGLLFLAWVMNFGTKRKHKLKDLPVWVELWRLMR